MLRIIPHARRPRNCAGDVGGVAGIDYDGDMEASVLEVLTALLSLVSAVGVLVVNSKVDRLTGRVDALEGTLHMVVAVVMGRKPSSGGPS